MRYSKINLGDMVNGEGIRVSIFVQGCTHHCKGCFNKESWDFDKGFLFTDEVLINVFKHFDRYKKIYSGISILGGEPLDNIELVKKVIDEFRSKFKDKTIWIWSGYTFEEILNNKEYLDIISKCDVLVDGEFKEELKDLDLRFRGSSNQRIIDLKKSLGCKKVVMWQC